jgi:hypothetical protein
VHGLFTSHGWIIQLLPPIIYLAFNINFSLTIVNIRLSNKRLITSKKHPQNNPRKHINPQKAGLSTQTNTPEGKKWT